MSVAYASVVVASAADASGVAGAAGVVVAASACVEPLWPSFAALPLPSELWFAEAPVGVASSEERDVGVDPAVYIAWCGAVKVTFVAVALTSRAAIHRRSRRGPRRARRRSP